MRPSGLVWAAALAALALVVVAVVSVNASAGQGRNRALDPMYPKKSYRDQWRDAKRQLARDKLDAARRKAREDAKLKRIAAEDAAADRELEAAERALNATAAAEAAAEAAEAAAEAEANGEPKPAGEGEGEEGEAKAEAEGDGDGEGEGKKKAAAADAKGKPKRGPQPYDPFAAAHGPFGGSKLQHPPRQELRVPPQPQHPLPYTPSTQQQQPVPVQPQPQAQHPTAQHQPGGSTGAPIRRRTHAERVAALDTEPLTNAVTQAMAGSGGAKAAALDALAGLQAPQLGAAAGSAAGVPLLYASTAALKDKLAALEQQRQQLLAQLYPATAVGDVVSGVQAPGALTVQQLQQRLTHLSRVRDNLLRGSATNANRHVLDPHNIASAQELAQANGEIQRIAAAEAARGNAAARAAATLAALRTVDPKAKFDDPNTDASGKPKKPHSNDDTYQAQNYNAAIAGLPPQLVTDEWPPKTGPYARPPQRKPGRDGKQQPPQHQSQQPHVPRSGQPQQHQPLVGAQSQPQLQLQQPARPMFGQPTQYSPQPQAQPQPQQHPVPQQVGGAPPQQQPVFGQPVTWQSGAPLSLPAQQYPPQPGQPAGGAVQLPVPALRLPPELQAILDTANGVKSSDPAKAFLPHNEWSGLPLPAKPGGEGQGKAKAKAKEEQSDAEEGDGEAKEKAEGEDAEEKEKKDDEEEDGEKSEGDEEKKTSDDKAKAKGDGADKKLAPDPTTLPVAPRTAKAPRAQLLRKKHVPYPHHYHAHDKWQYPKQQKASYCPLDRVAVKSADSFRTPIHADAVTKHVTAYTGYSELTRGPGSATALLGDMTKLPVVDVREHFFSCWDGRHDYAVMGTAGGDIAEFLLALNALEHTRPLSQALTEEQVYRYMQSYVATRQLFYLHSDEEHMSLWRTASGVRDPLRPQSEAERKEVLRLAPIFLGCDHMQLMYTREAEYDTRHALTEAVIRAAVRILTDPLDPLRTRMKFVVLRGAPNREQAHIQVYSPTGTDRQFPQAGCLFHTPLVVPKHAVNDHLRTAFVTHPRAQFEGRAALADFLMRTERKPVEWRDQVLQLMQQIGGKQHDLSKGILTGTAFGVEPHNPPHRTTPVPTFIAEFQLTPPYDHAAYPNPTYR